jgi:predicted HD phosphohydrolase
MFKLELRDRVVKLYEKAGDLMYPGEPINQWQHGWQCAQLAKAAGASHELQAECLQFEANSFFTDAVALRVWDDRAKDITTITVDKSVAL